MESKVIAIAIEMMKVAMVLSFPVLLVSMIVGLIISIFQATTQINESTLSFIPKILGIVIVIILTMPWMLNEMTDFAKHVFISKLLKTSSKISGNPRFISLSILTLTGLLNPTLSSWLLNTAISGLGMALLKKGEHSEGLDKLRQGDGSILFNIKSGLSIK